MTRAGGSRPSLLPTGSIHMPTAAVIAVMTFAMMLVAAAGLALTSASGSIARGIENRFVIQLPGGTAEDLQKALAIAQSSPGVRNVRSVPESEMRETLAQWIGDAATSDDLPVPALVNVELAPGANSASLGRRISSSIAGATVIAESAELGPMLRSIRALQWLALSLVLLVIAATAAAVVLAARGAFDTHRPTVEIMHGIGATDLQLTRLFQRKIATDAVVGATAGALAAALGLLAVGTGGAAIGSSPNGSAGLGWQSLAAIALLPLMAVGLAAVVARWTVLRALRETL